MKINEVLIKPRITEKTTQKIKENVYSFEVARNSNKNQIKEVVEKLYNVVVDEVRTVTHKGKKQRIGRRNMFKTLSTKKFAYIKVKSGKIDLFPKAQ